MTPNGDVPERPLRERCSELALTADQLRSTCAPDAFEFATTADVAVSPGTVGQGRAIEALELGLELRRSGYHVFVSGPEGTGRTSTVASLLDRIAPSLPVPPDRAYVHRFDDPDRPELLTLPAGRARQLAGAIDELRERLRTQIPALLESRDLEKQREAVSQRYAREQDADTAALRDRLAKDGMGLVQVAIGPGLMVPDVAPLRGGEPVPAEEVEASLPARGKAAFRRRLERAKRDVHEHFLTLRDRHRAFEREIRSLIGRAAEGLVADELREVRAAFPDDAVVAFISNIERDAVATAVALADSPAADLLARQLDRYRVNVVADRSGLTGAPVMREDYPTRQNLVGTLERVLGAGPFAWAADASTIRAGSLLRADGGFFVARASDVLAEPGAWDALKRAMLNGMLQVGAASTSMLGLPRSLEPDPVPLDLKVVLIGERRLYDLLYAFDPDFRKLFGIRAEFEPDLRRTPEAVHSYAALVAKVCENEHLPHADPAALAALVEEGALLAGRGDRLTAQLSTIADIVREAAFWAGRRKASRIERVDIDEAVRRRRARDGSLEERMQELLLDGTLLVATSGASVGQVNALSVYDLGYTAFGKPTRITASVSPGRAGIINVEREARMSGGIYDKGVLIISGFLRRRYAHDVPLSLTASLTFEQSYAGVDGDSASIAEVVALLSELAGIKVDSAVAITGSINQHGEVQPVGGVNEKIRGWHALCHARGSDCFAVVLPAANIRDLMLDRGIVDDVQAGRFLVFAVHHVEEALEIALGVPMERLDDAVRTRLARFADALRDAPAADMPPVAGDVRQSFA